MAYGLRVMAGFALLAGCTSGSDIDSDTDAFAAPDIAGRYDFKVQGTNGCDSNSSLITDWAVGPVIISGAADALTFDFLDDVKLLGSVDQNYSFQFGGTITDSPWTIAMFGNGSVIENDTGLTLDGALSGTADDDGVESNDCTIEGPFLATRLGS